MGERKKHPAKYLENGFTENIFTLRDDVYNFLCGKRIHEKRKIHILTICVRKRSFGGTGLHPHTEFPRFGLHISIACGACETPNGHSAPYDGYPRPACKQACFRLHVWPACRSMLPAASSKRSPASIPNLALLVPMLIFYRNLRCLMPKMELSLRL